jgi:hypothetical protein
MGYVWFNFQLSKKVENVIIKDNNKKVDYDELCGYTQNSKNPSPPISPSTKSQQENALSPDFMKYASIDNKESSSSSVRDGKKQIKRKKNSEEHSFFLWNMFYLFFLPYVCRIKHVTDEDIPEPDTRDGSELCYEKTKDRWGSRYSKYIAELEKYEAEKSKDPKSE